ncbi:MAG: cytochrome c oxidase accessory protein CcoG [Sandaracinaceae bacterium]
MTTSAPKTRLPVVKEQASSLHSDGRRNHVHPADVSGRHVKGRYVVFFVLILIWAALPWVQVGGHPALYLDIANRHFYLFGSTFNAQDAWLVFFLLSGAGLTTMLVTTIWGRIWCGWACPQTVFMEGVFRRIERYVEGPRNKRLRRNAGPMTGEKFARKVVKHVLFILAALLISHIFLSFFVSMPSLVAMVQTSPSENPEAFAWMGAMTLLLYGNFAWFREQLCLVICPYGRLQSVLTDKHSMVVGYDVERGEPRGKAKDPNAGDCVDCNRCVAVCPTGIDIRNGLQLDCIGCTACIDACDSIMDKLKRPRGLVRYDSLAGIEGEPKRVFRPRLLLYTGLLLAWGVGAAFAFQGHDSFEANLLRLRGAPYHLIEVDEVPVVRNLFQVHLVNKGGDTATFHLRALDAEGQSVRIAHEDVELGSMDGREIPVYVDVPADSVEPGQRLLIEVRRHGDPAEDAVRTEAPLLAPRR